MSVVFEDFTVEVTEALDAAAVVFLMEAAAEIQVAVQRLSRSNTGQLRGSWDYQIDDKKAAIGSPLQNAIWEEFGTGEYALHGDGRKGGWSYQDATGKWWHTYGKTPNRTLHRAFEGKKNAIINRARQIFGETG